MDVSPLTTVQRELDRLQRLTYRLLALAAIAVVGFAGFAVYEVRELRHHQATLRELTLDLCETLERAGILIRVEQDPRCER